MEGEYRRLLAEANPAQRAMLVWYWATGCRPSELVAFRRANFERKGRLVIIPTSKSDHGRSLEAREHPQVRFRQAQAKPKSSHRGR